MWTNGQGQAGPAKFEIALVPILVLEVNNFTERGKLELFTDQTGNCPEPTINANIINFKMENLIEY